MMLLFFIFVGLCVGSFIHVIYCRFDKNLTVRQIIYTVSFSRSRCPYCQHRLAAWQLIPLLSWLILKGRCNVCHHAIALRYLLCEISIALLFLLIGLLELPIIYRLILLMLGCWFFILAMIDYRDYLLPDWLTQPLMWLGLLFAYFGFSKLTLEDAFIGSIVGFFLLWVPAQLFYIFKKKQGLGGGDVKLLAALGTWLPYQQLPSLLIIASLLGLIYILLIRICQKQRINIIPFGPFLLLAGYLLLLQFYVML